MTATAHARQRLEPAQGRERRCQHSRRSHTDKRRYIRYDGSGGDRRTGYARRSTDAGLHQLNFE
jgi:hypothetical protein